MDRAVIETGLADRLRSALDAPDLVVERVEDRRDPAAEAGQPWLDVKYGSTGPRDWHGVVPVGVALRRAPAAAVETRELVIKVSPQLGIGDTLIPWIVDRADIALPRPYGSFRTTAETRATGDREADAYELARREPTMAASMPACLGRIDDPASGEHALVLAFVTLDGLDASGAHLDWPAGRLTAAARAAARWHAALADRSGDIDWAGRRPSTADRVADIDLYRALLDDAHRRFPAIVTDTVATRRHELLDTLPDWHAVKDELPATLAHNDFNARNVGFDGGTPIALDWELARVDNPTRDLVELLTFGLGPDFHPDDLHTVLAAARSTLEENGLAIDTDLWREAVRAEVRVEAVDRLGMQSIFAAAFPLPYFERIQATVERLLDLTD